MANVYIKTVDGGEDTTPSGTDAIELDDGTTSKWTLLSAVWQAGFNYISSLTAKTTLTGADIIPLSNSEASNVGNGITWTNFMGQVAAFTSTFTNKRITRRKSTEASNATPSINSDNVDCHQITALAAAITSVTITGTPTDGQKLRIEVTDNATARAFAGGASLVNGPATLPTTTIISKRLYIELEWNDTVSKWVCMATGSVQ